MFWNIVDVCDAVEVQRLIVESFDNRNGEWYNLVVIDELGFIFQQELQVILQKLYLDMGIGGIYREG